MLYFGQIVDGVGALVGWRVIRALKRKSQMGPTRRNPLIVIMIWSLIVFKELPCITRCHEPAHIKGLIAEVGI